MIAKPFALLCGALSVLLCLPAHARAKPWIGLAQIAGVASLGASIPLALEARDHKQKADDLYKEYEQAASTSQAEHLYDEVTDNDFRSGVHLALSVSLAVTAFHLLFFSKGPELGALPDGSVVPEHGKLALRLERDPTKQRVGLSLAKRL